MNNFEFMFNMIVANMRGVAGDGEALLVVFSLMRLDL